MQGKRMRENPPIIAAPTCSERFCRSEPKIKNRSPITERTVADELRVKNPLIMEYFPDVPSEKLFLNKVNESQAQPGERQISFHIRVTSRSTPAPTAAATESGFSGLFTGLI